MSRIIVYLGTRYDVYGFNTLQDITICSFYENFDLHLWPSTFDKVTWTLILKCILCCWMFVPKLKFVGSVEFEIWTFVLSTGSNPCLYFTYTASLLRKKGCWNKDFSNQTQIDIDIQYKEGGCWNKTLDPDRHRHTIQRRGPLK